MTSLTEAREYLNEHIRRRELDLAWTTERLATFTSPQQVGPEFMALHEEHIRRESALAALRSLAKKIA